MGLARLFSVLALLAAVWPAGAAQRRDSLIYSRFDIDPGESRYFPFPSKEAGARLDVRFEVLSPKEAAGVRVRVQSEQEFERLRGGRPPESISVASYRRDGKLQTRLAQPGGYVVVIDSRLEARRRVRVDLEVVLVTGPDPETLPVAYASPRRRLVVVVASAGVFLLTALLAGRALLRALRWRPRAPLTPFV